MARVQIAPNPMHDITRILLPADAGEVQFKLYDMLGRVVQVQNTSGAQIEVLRNDLANGMYTYRIEAEDGRVASGKLLLNNHTKSRNSLIINIL